MIEKNIDWIKKGLKDFTAMVFIGMIFIVFCFVVISGLISLGMPPAYASTIISLCLLFSGSMMFSYFEHKRILFEKEKMEIITDMREKRKKHTDKEKEN